MKITNRVAIVVFLLSMFICVGSYANEKPVAVVGDDIAVETWRGAEAVVTLDASGSYDPDGNDLTYQWSWVEDGNTYDSNAVSLELSLPLGRYTVCLVVNDGLEDSEPNCVKVNVSWLKDYVFVDPVDGNDAYDGVYYKYLDGKNGPKATIQSAVDRAVDGQTVLLLDGVYTGQGNRDIQCYDKKITIVSEHGPDNCIVNCQAGEPQFHNGFNFGAGADSNTVLDGVTIINAYTTSGGGVYCQEGSAAVIKNCVIRKCVASENGGAIANCGGKVLDCDIEYNMAYEMGGGLYNCAYVEGCNVYKNQAHFGGGFNGCDGVIVDCNVASNQAWGDGGGFCDCDANMTDLGVSDNVAKWSGGFYSCNGNISKCIITNNQSNFGSGAMYWCNGAVKNCTIVSNQASYTNGTAGGLAYCNGEIRNTIIWDNSGLQVADCNNIKYCCVQDSNDSNNINMPPLFADANNRDYHLMSEAGRWDPNQMIWVKDQLTSACIDAGDRRDSYNDEFWPNGKRINLGVYGDTAEASLSLSEVGVGADFNDDLLINFVDYAILINNFADSYSFEYMNMDLNHDNKIDFNDIEVVANHWLEVDEPNFASPIILDFESGDFAEGFNSYGDVNWVVVAGGANDSNFAAQTSLMSDSQQCVLEYALNLDEDRNRISFNFKVSSEKYSDKFSFYVDDELVGQWSGEIDWTLATFDIEVGPHVFKWVYEKDWSYYQGRDLVWLDDVNIYYEP